VLDSLKEKKLSVVFGAGGNRDKTKRIQMGRVANRYGKKIYLTSDNPRDEEPMKIIEDIGFLMVLPIGVDKSHLFNQWRSGIFDIYFGDSNNDKNAFKGSHLSVAPANLLDDVYDDVDIVLSETNNEGAVFKALQRFIQI
jgi:hydroxymethylpyrimidine pyrophosphatase-like HAD family hydrolase